MTLKSIDKLRKYASEVVKSPQYIGGETFDLMMFADEIEREVNERYMLIKPRTIEDVLYDLLEEWATRPTSEDVLVEKYAEELRQIGVGE